ncbi:unnamed protein product [Mucor hiemalis]
MTYPSYWTLEKIAYLRSLAQMAGIVDKHDHPDRLLMYSEGASILSHLQVLNMGHNIKQGYTYLICDMGGTGIRMSLYDVKEPSNTSNNFKSESYHDWDMKYSKEPSQLLIGARDISVQCQRYILSRLSAPTKFFTGNDMIARSNQKKDFLDFFEDVIANAVDGLSKETIAQNEPRTYQIPESLQPQVLKLIDQKSGCSNSGTPLLQKDGMHNENLMLMENRTTLTISPFELEQNVMRPVCDKIVHYLGSILQGSIGNSIEAIILVGGLSHSVYLMELIEEICSRTDTKILAFTELVGTPFCGFDILDSALVKSEYDLLSLKSSKVILDQKNSLKNPVDGNSPEVYVFVEYGNLKTYVSYIHTEPGQPFDIEKIEHVSDWRGLSPYDNSLSTMDVPDDNFLSTMDVVLTANRKENVDRSKHFLKLIQGEETELEYYTFEEREKNTILFTHLREVTRISSTINTFYDILCTKFQNFTERLKRMKKQKNKKQNLQLIDHLDTRIGTTYTRRNINTYTFIETQKLISYQEFSIIFFDYLTSFLYDYILSQIGPLNGRFQFCITRESLGDRKFKLSDAELYNIVSNCGMISADAHKRQSKPLILEHSQATSIYCREMLDSVDMSNRTEAVFFVQVQLYEVEFQILLNGVPPLSNKNNVAIGQDGKSWKGIFKYSTDTTFFFNSKDATCDNLWIHLQTHHDTLFIRCERHQSPRKFFDSNNMQVFKRLVRNYISTAALELVDDEKVNEIFICESDQEGNCCRVLITNLDLLQYCIIPTINSIASKIHSYAYDEMILNQKRKISNIFVMGVFLLCRYKRDYKYLENILLMKLKKYNLFCSNDLGLQSMINSTELKITAIDTQKPEHRRNEYGGIAEDDDNDNWNQDPIPLISLKGSVLYSLDPENQLVERISGRTYAIKIRVDSPAIDLHECADSVEGIGKVVDDDEEIDIVENMNDDNSTIAVVGDKPVYVMCEHLGNTKEVTFDTLIPILRKETPLSSMEPTGGGEISASFTLFNCVKNVDVSIEFLILDEDDTLHSDVEYIGSKGHCLGAFLIPNALHTYPIEFKLGVYQQDVFRAWVEYGQNEKSDSIRIYEDILMKDFHFE